MARERFPFRCRRCRGDAHAATDSISFLGADDGSFERRQRAFVGVQRMRAAEATGWVAGGGRGRRGGSGTASWRASPAPRGPGNSPPARCSADHASTASNAPLSRSWVRRRSRRYGGSFRSSTKRSVEARLQERPAHRGEGGEVAARERCGPAPRIALRGGDSGLWDARGGAPRAAGGRDYPVRAAYTSATRAHLPGATVREDGCNGVVDDQLFRDAALVGGEAQKPVSAASEDHGLGSRFEARGPASALRRASSPARWAVRVKMSLASAGRGRFLAQAEDALLSKRSRFECSWAPTMSIGLPGRSGSTGERTPHDAGRGYKRRPSPASWQSNGRAVAWFEPSYFLGQ